MGNPIPTNRIRTVVVDPVPAIKGPIVVSTGTADAAIAAVCPDKSGNPCIDLEDVYAGTQDYAKQQMTPAERRAYNKLQNSLPAGTKAAQALLLATLDAVANQAAQAIQAAMDDATQTLADSVGAGWRLDLEVQPKGRRYRLVTRVVLPKEAGKAGLAVKVPLLKKALAALPI